MTNTLIQVAIPDWMAYLAALSAAIISIWALVSKIRNSGKTEVELKLADVKHEQEQNKKIEEIERLAEHIKSELDTLKSKVSEFEGAPRRIDRLERQLDELLILLANADKG